MLQTLGAFHLNFTEIVGTSILLQISRTNLLVACPACHHYSRRVHSRYTRTVADLPFSDRIVKLKIKVRRFFCANSACSSFTFVEPLSPAIPPFARRTQRLTEALVNITYGLVGEAGARLAFLLKMPSSSRTLLRLLNAQPIPQYPTPRVLGVDEWSWKKGGIYGAILVDLERRSPVELLKDRTAETFAKWLQTHPGVEIICRDRDTVLAVKSQF
ncbi:MAG: transposase [Bacteroidetes bacterium]|nr:transposase [Bacteroidota bacterium]